MLELENLCLCRGIANCVSKLCCRVVRRGCASEPDLICNMTRVDASEREREYRCCWRSEVCFVLYYVGVIGVEGLWISVSKYVSKEGGRAKDFEASSLGTSTTRYY